MKSNQNSPKKRWTAYGKIIEEDGGMNRPSLKAEYPLDIHEELQNINMGDGTVDPFGIPISTGLAVMLIKNMLDELNKSEHGFLTQFREGEQDVIRELLLNSMGITFDKSQLLRIISQPKCEGVRFYHALRKNNEGESDSTTLVCVGVDKDGYDLNYKKDSVEEQQSISVREKKTCESLVDDWGHPPGSGGFISPLADKLSNPRYVLWRMAEKK